MVSYYENNATGEIYSSIPGYLPGAYYWWECGAMFGTLIDYWRYTGDTSYNHMTNYGLQFQVGPNADFSPPNASKWLGNDDQGFWALSAMSAAETNFDEPASDGPSWLSLAQAVFNEQTKRWDPTTCGGGMRWQSLQFNAGWSLKNSISNGIYFQLGARLARYTGNDTYAQLAMRTYDWMERIGLVTEEYFVYDNSEADKLNCTEVDHTQWSYNVGTMLIGAAYMYDYTNKSGLWADRTAGFLNATTSVMFPNGVMTEICEATNACNVDQHSFKAYLSRWMAATTQLAPFTYGTIIELLRSNAQKALAQCTGSSTLTAQGQNIGTACGLKWNTNGVWDGSDGVGQQMAALEVLLGTLIQETKPPLTNATGGTSIGNPNAGSGNSVLQNLENLRPATTGDRVGAAFLTAIFIAAGTAAMVFMWSEAYETPDKIEKALYAARSRLDLSLCSKGKGRVPKPAPFGMQREKLGSVASIPPVPTIGVKAMDAARRKSAARWMHVDTGAWDNVDDTGSKDWSEMGTGSKDWSEMDAGSKDWNKIRKSLGSSRSLELFGKGKDRGEAMELMDRPNTALGV